MKTVCYRIAQCTWGILQTLLGLVLFLLHRGAKHYTYHGAIITEWSSRASISLGLFVFVTKEPFFAGKLSAYPKQELAARLLVHEYGHTVQSLILGPLYLLVMGIPSSLWANLPALARRRREQGISYFAFFTERWANTLGERVTGKPAMERFVID
ncbi:MAG: hypothetical protein IJC67_00230 [Clostridia bacterium]|nr:hypothetical protein [Clostridia bacterium]